jgi:hypothetical protein
VGPSGKRLQVQLNAIRITESVSDLIMFDVKGSHAFLMLVA